MPKRLLLTLPLILSLQVGFAYAQDPTSHERVETDSLLWTNPDTIPPYPYRARLDSLRSGQAQAIAEAYTADSTAIIDPIEPSPSLYVVDEHGREYHGLEARSYWAERLPEGYWAVVQFDVAWNGQIRAARLRYYKGSIAGVDLRQVVQQVRAAPSNLYGFPAPEQCRMLWLLKGR